MFFFFSSRRRHTRYIGDWSSDVCSSDLPRWPTRVRVWRELLLAAAAGEAPALERARLHGLTLLAAEARGSLSARSEERRVGEEGMYGEWGSHLKKKWEKFMVTIAGRQIR